MFEILKDRDIDLLTDGVLEVMEKTGIFCDNQEILKAVESAGAEVDFKKKTAKFPRKVIAKFIDEIKKEDKKGWEKEIKGENRKTMLSGWVPYVEYPAKFESPYIPFLFHQLATFYYDDEKKERRKGNRDDFITLIKLGDTLHPEQGSGHSLNLSDVSPEIEPLEAAVTLIEYSKNPRGVYVEDIRQIDYLKEIEGIAGIRDPHWHWLANVSFATPLKLGKDIAERFVYMIKTGDYPAKVYSMAVSGVNTPVTTAGCIVITAAEFLALWFCARLFNPKIPLTGFVLTGTMDMKSGGVDYWTFDTLIRRFSVCEFIRKWMGVSVSAGIGEWGPTKVPGFYAALEKAYLAMAIAAFTGFHPEIGMGHIEAGLSISPAQLLLDREIAKGLKFLESPLINEETIGMETILDVGFGIEKNYLQSEHTLKNFGSSLWNAEFFDKNGWSVENEEKMLKKAREKVQQLISEYKKPEVDPDKISNIRQVIEKAKKNLL